jgi:hypothetical protein
MRVDNSVGNSTTGMDKFGSVKLHKLILSVGDRSPSEYLYAVVPRNVFFAQRRVARLNLTRHAAATAICSRSSREGGGFGGARGLRDSSGGARGLGSGSIASWLWSAERVWGARGEERPAES